MKQKLNLMSGAALAVLALAPACAARAQDASGGKTIGDVVITATHTGATNLQKTPISVDVVTGSDLTKDQLTSFKDLNQAVPSLQVKQDYQNPTVYIRGVGGNNGNADDTDVGLYMDGVYLARPLIVMYSDFNDLDRVEVVEGPQGTLFGRNSAGGAVNFISRQAPDHFQFQNTLSVGNYAMIDEAATVGGPLADNMQASLSFSHVQHSGYIHNVDPGVGDIDNANRTAARAQLRWEITPDITNTVRADYLYTNENWALNDALQAPPSYPDPLQVSIIGKLNQVDMNRLPQIIELGYGFSDELNWKINDNLSLKSLSALRTEDSSDRDAGDVTDVSHSTTLSPTHEWEATQEFNLVNHYGPFSGVLGYFYFDEFYKFIGSGSGNLNTASPYYYFQITEMPTISQALFFNETYQFTPTLGVTVGGRYTEEHRTLNDEVNIFGSGTNFAQVLNNNPTLAACVVAKQACGGNYVGDLNHSYSSFTPKVAVNWQATPESMIYGSVTEGYKSGGFNFTYTGSAIAPPDFGPETIWSYEIGAKNDLFDHTLRLNAALFYYDWTGLQFNSLIAPATSIVSNAGNASETGFELNVLSKPARGWTFTVGLTALASRYNSFPKFSVNNALKPYLVGYANYNAAAGTVNVAGNEVAGAPPVNVIFTGQKDFDLPDGADFYVRGEYQYQAKTYFEPSNVPIASRPADGMFDASIGYSPAHSHWTVALWGKNLTNQIIPTGLGGGNPLGLFVSDPRTFGLRVNYTY